jgi:hypothetical protein
MITRVVFTSHSLDHGYVMPANVMEVLENTLLENLKSHSRILFGSGAEVHAFLAWLKTSTQISPATKQKWQSLLAELQKLGRVGLIDPSTNLEEVHSKGEVKFVVGKNADVVVVGGPKAREILGDDLDFLLDEEPPVITTLFNTDQTPQFKNFLELEKVGVHAFGESREVFWQQVLQPLLLTSKNVYLLDKYLFAQILHRIDHPRLQRSKPSEQLLWLLGKIDSTASKGVHIHLIGAAEKNKTSTTNRISEIVEYLRKHMKLSGEGAIREISIFEATEVRKFPHDRHIRFDSGFAVLMNSGFDRLQMPTIEDEHGMGWQFISAPKRLEGFRKSETAMMDLSTTLSQNFLRLEW